METVINLRKKIIISFIIIIVVVGEEEFSSCLKDGAQLMVVGLLLERKVYRWCVNFFQFLLSLM